MIHILVVDDEPSIRETLGAIRDRIDDGLRLEDGVMPKSAVSGGMGMEFGDYIDWRAATPPTIS